MEKKVNYNRRHNYYVQKTIKFLQSLGITAEKIETNYQIWAGGRPMFVKRDLWGSDIIGRSQDDGILFIQVKTGRHQVRQGVKQMAADPNWPTDGCRRFVIFWPPRRKLKEGPVGCEVTTGDEGAGSTRPLPTFSAHTAG